MSTPKPFATRPSEGSHLSSDLRASNHTPAPTVTDKAEMTTVKVSGLKERTSAIGSVTRARLHVGNRSTSSARKPKATVGIASATSGQVISGGPSCTAFVLLRSPAQITVHRRNAYADVTAIVSPAVANTNHPTHSFTTASPWAACSAATS